MKIFVSLLIAALTLTGCAKKDPNALPNDGIVKECSEIKVAKEVKTGIELQCLGNGQQTLFQSSLRGPMVVNVFGSWCKPCKDEIPYFREFYENYQDQVGLVGIAVEEVKKSDTTDFIKGVGIIWPSLYDPDGRTRGKLGMGVPVTFFVDSKGKIVGQIVGAVPDSQSIVKAANKFLKLNLQ